MASPTVTLTFDNGPWPGVTDRILDILADRSILTTFFVVGKQLERPGARPLAERAVGEGHWIGNHSYTHRVALGELDDPLLIDREIDACEALLDGLRHPHRLFRPFGNGGVIDHRLLGAYAVRRLAAAGSTCVLWDSVPHDWDDPTGWVDRAMADITTTDHCVVVLHDLPGGALNRLDEFLDRLTAVGANIVQDFPDRCVIVRDGQRTAAFAGCFEGGADHRKDHHDEGEGPDDGS